MFKKLIRLANKLDKKREVKDADLLDRVIKKIAEGPEEYDDFFNEPHDDDDEDWEDEVDAGFYEAMESGDLPDEPDDLEDIMSLEELKIQSKALSKLLEREELTDSMREMTSKMLESVNSQIYLLETVSMSGAPGLGRTDFLGKNPNEESDPTYLPIAEASKIRNKK